MSDIYGQCMILGHHMLKEHNISHYLLERKEKRDNNRKERADRNSPPYKENKSAKPRAYCQQEIRIESLVRNNRSLLKSLLRVADVNARLV
jgi:hypothetical protein